MTSKLGPYANHFKSSTSKSPTEIKFIGILVVGKFIDEFFESVDNYRWIYPLVNPLINL